MTEPVDEVWIQSVFEYEGKKFQSVGKGSVELGTEEEKKEAEEKRKEKEEGYKSLLECMKKHLDEYIKEVRLSTRLTSSAVCLVGDVSDISPQLEQILKASGQEIPTVKRILEINPNHEILNRIQAIFNENNDDSLLKDYSELLYGQAVLAESGHLPDPAKFSKQIADLMIKAI